MLALRWIFFTVLSVYSIVLLPPPSHASGWVDDWLQQKVVTGSGYYQGDTRGYFTGGGFNARWSQGSEYPVTISPPRLKFGCGGIDAYMGGFSFLSDPNYLQKKLEAVLANASAVAFDMALQVLAEQAATSIKSLTSMADKLNSLQLDSCGLGKDLVATIKGEPNRSKAAVESSMDYLLRLGVKDNPDELAQDSKSQGGADPVGDDEKTSSCPAEIKDIFINTTKTYLQALGDKRGMPANHVNLLRGFIGDANVEDTLDTNTKRRYMVYEIPPCKENNEAISSFVEGKAYVRPADGDACTQITDTNADLVNYTSAILFNYVTNAKSKVSQTTATTNFLDQIPLPVKTAMDVAISTGQENVMVALLADLVSKAYAYSIARDLYAHMASNTYLARQVIQKQGAYNLPDCQLEIFAYPVLTISDRMLERAEHLMDELRADYKKAVDEWTPIMAIVKRFEGLKAKSHKGFQALVSSSD